MRWVTSATCLASCCTSTSKSLDASTRSVIGSITGDRTQGAREVGWDYVFVAIDDHSRVAFAQVYPDETKCSAESFLRASVTSAALNQFVAA